MVGARLEVNVHLVTASTSASQNVVTAANHAGVEVLGTIYEPLADSAACLTADERELGVALIDIGGGTTDLIVYRGAVVRHSAVIPVGGEHFSNDIAVGLRTPIPEAEKLKKAWGEKNASRLVDSVVEIPSVGERPSRVVTYASLSDIIVPRAQELLELVQAEIGRSGGAKQLGAGVVLTGGGAKLGGLTALAETVFGVPVRVGIPAGLESMGETLLAPAFSTVVGLALFGYRQRLLHDAQQPAGFWGKFWQGVRGRK